MINWNLIIKNIKTTICGLIAAAAIFVVTEKPAGVPILWQHIAGFIASGGLVALGIVAKDSSKKD